MSDIISRADRDQGDIQSLANSIVQVGLLQPILLRPLPDGKYEVVDGRRRFAALTLLKNPYLENGDYVISEHEGAKDPVLAAHIANVERKQLTPAEEVQHLSELAQTHTVEQMATLFGRTPGWIARRLKIATLIPEWLKVLDDPERSPMWTLDKLALIARQSDHVQKKLLFMIPEELSQNYS